MIKTNRDIVALARCGFAHLDYSDVPEELSLDMFLNIRKISSKIDELMALEKELADSVKSKIFDTKEKEALLAKADSSNEEFKTLSEEFSRKYARLLEELYEQDATIDGIKQIPFEIYFSLKKHNTDKLVASVDRILEGILFTAE